MVEVREAERYGRRLTKCNQAIDECPVRIVTCWLEYLALFPQSQTLFEKPYISRREGHGCCPVFPHGRPLHLRVVNFILILNREWCCNETG